MRSIRLSLIVYFLLLLGAALTGVTYFCYQTTEEAFAAKEKSSAALWEKQFDEQKARVENEFDAKLRAQARVVAGKAVWVHNRIESLNILGVLGSHAFNGGHLNCVLPLAETASPAVYMRVSQMRPLDVYIQHPEDDNYLPIVEEGQYFQTYFPSKELAFPLEASDTLGNGVWTLDKAMRAKAEEGQVTYDDIKMFDGKTVRRVTWKATASLTRRGMIVEPVFKDYFAKTKGFGRPLPPPPLSGEDRPITMGFKPPIYIQFGVDTSVRDKAIEELRANLQRDISKMRDDLEEARAELRSRLLWICAGTFAALVLGGFVLVWRGLAPLKRLSDAVSRVSEKDFHLPIDAKTLPSELKPIAGGMAATLEQLKRAFGREKQAAADISHELRTPVAALLTRLDITLRKPRSAEEYREVLVDCRESGRQISTLVERLLALARLDAGAEQLRPCEVDVAALADQCAALVRPLAEARGLRMDVSHDGPACLSADPNKLREVLTNLLHNAIEYNRPSGTIALRVERNNGHLDMEVRDTGIGIAPEMQRHIFERFFRADPSRQADTPHAGLGLAIVKGYVDLMGGSITVDSMPGTGSTFRVRLPATAK